ncbi:MAG: DUF418 domain-containing protein [Pseudomonadota bacterium]
MNKPERIPELDVLRGFALLGVFIVHFVGVPFYELPLEESQRALWESQLQHSAAVYVSDLLFQNKANTLFATLFGMGFWIMLQRISARDPNFVRIYQRRLAALLAIGLLNLFLVFPGDVLHVYALIGWLLLAMRNWSSNTMLYLGLALALLADPVFDHVLPSLGGPEEVYESAMMDAFNEERYLVWVKIMTGAYIDEEFLHGGLIAWALYLLGRFLIGAWVMREQWIQRARRHLPRLRSVAAWLLIIGLAAEVWSLLIFKEKVSGSPLFDGLLHAVGAPMMAVGYALTLVYLCNSARWQRLALWLAPVGRIALTAYVLHGAIFTLLYMPFGLGMLGTLGPAHALLAALALYSFLTAFSFIWLRRYRYGPLEYLWRWVTYREQPAFRVNRIT